MYSSMFKVLRTLKKCKPHTQANIYYINSLVEPTGYNEARLKAICKELESKGYIEFADADKQYILPLEKAHSYKQVLLFRIAEFVTKSIIVPAAVAFITALITALLSS